METEVKEISQLEKQTESLINYHRNELNKVLASQQLIRQLPSEILTYNNWYTFYNISDKKYHLETWCVNPEEANKLVKTFKGIGVYGLTCKHKGSNRWKWVGTFMLDENEIELVIDGGEKPPTCELIEKKETKEVITYEVICKETGEVIK